MLFARCSAEAGARGCMRGHRGGAVRPACIRRQDPAGAGGPPRVGPLTRRRPGWAAGAPRPGRCCTRCARGLAGAPLGRRPPLWLLDTGSRALRGDRTEQGKGFQTQAAIGGIKGTPAPCLPFFLKPKARHLLLCSLRQFPGVRGVKEAAGQEELISHCREDGLLKRVAPVPERMREMTDGAQEFLKSSLHSFLLKRWIAMCIGNVFSTPVYPSRYPHA